MDTNVSINAHEAENAYTLEATPRGFRKIPSYVIKWEYPLMMRDDGLNPGKLKSAASRGAVYAVKDLITPIAVETLTTKQLKEAVMEKTGVSQTVFYELLKELQDAPGVSYEPKDKKWSYTKPSEPRLT